MKSNSLFSFLLNVVLVILVCVFINSSCSPEKSSNENASQNNTTEDSIQTDNLNSDTDLNTQRLAIDTFYKQLIATNKVDESDIGSLTIFKKQILSYSLNDCKNLYKDLKNKGLTVDEIGDLDGFLTKIESLRVSTISVSPDKDLISEEIPDLPSSEYKGNSLKNGSSPLDDCFGKGVYSGNATLTIKNGSNSDAIVCLYSISNGRTIRNEYVQKETNFTMDNIAQGYYKIRVFYGNDWNPTRVNSCGTEGDFDSDVNFSEFDQKQYFEDSEKGYTIATITLYAVKNGNASTSKISPEDFFNK